jgi:hypothetical protein
MGPCSHARAPTTYQDGPTERLATTHNNDDGRDAFDAPPRGLATPTPRPQHPVKAVPTDCGADRAPRARAAAGPGPPPACRGRAARHPSAAAALSRAGPRAVGGATAAARQAGRRGAHPAGGGGRPAQRRQVDAAEPPRRRKGVDRVTQGTDHPATHYRRLDGRRHPAGQGRRPHTHVCSNTHPPYWVAWRSGRTTSPDERVCARLVRWWWTRPALCLCARPKGTSARFVLSKGRSGALNASPG